ncbi:peptidase, S9A/B/C family, catalytic domain protein [Trichuris suis]|nr:peptidase, S9A/B/C family, catalytic domain protein [Trichuris suis]
MTGDAPQRNWWGIGIALLIILSIAAIISIAIVLLAPGNSNQYTGKQPISIEDIVSPKASEANPEPKWLSSDTFAYKDSNCSIWSVRIRNGGTTVTQLVDEQSCQNRKFSSFKPSPSGSCIAFAYSTRQIYRHSETARYNITCSLIGVDHDREYPVGPNKTGSELIQLFLWSPGSNDSFAFVYNNNIYYQEHVLSDPVQITASATESNFIRNGVADWVYEEEVLETSNALWWSYKGRSIAYATFDDRNVEKVILPYYPNDSVYPTNVEIAYPKVAASLPEVSLHVWDKITGETLSVIPPPEVLELREKYLFSVNWVQSSGSDESLLVVWANRVQNSVFISYCKPPKYECILNYNQNYDDLWAEPSHYKIRFTDESKYYVILPQLVKESSNGPEYRYSHVAQITIPISGQNGKATFLTHGSWEVSKIVGLSKKENRVYFIAALPNPRQRHLYSVSASPNGDDPVCLTCNLTKLGCSYVAAVFSYDGGHYILYCQGPDIPSVRLFSVGNEKPLFIVEDNLLLRKYFDTKRFPDVQYKEVQLPNGYSKVFKRSLSFAYACQSILAALLKILYPPDFEEQSNKDFLPAVLKVYAGPNTQSVLERLDFSFDTYLASSRKYVVVYIDGRGSGARGSKYTSSVYKNLGFPEIQDQIEAFKIFISQSSLVDRQKAAVWGWSYGGFSTARIVQMNAFQTFKCAISVAPVTNFRLYDAAYTERYLGLYENNVVGYERTNVAKNVTAFGLGKYLLIHGSFDDNVHYQNTAAFVEALTAQNIKFQMMMEHDLFTLSRTAHSSFISIAFHLMLLEHTQSCAIEPANPQHAVCHDFAYVSRGWWICPCGMFRSIYQSGLISLLSSVGYEPLQLWATEVRNGSIKRIRDEEISDMVIEVISRDVRETCITFPADRTEVLAIKLPLIAFLVKNLNEDFTFEVEVTDVRGDRHWLRASNFQKKSRQSPLICTMPLRLEEGWNYVQMDMSDLTKRAFGRKFSELSRIQVHANCRLRRIFCADRIYSEDELPPEFRLYKASRS